MIVLPLGMVTPKLVEVKLQPMPKMTSHFWRKSCTVLGMARPHDPSESGWFSGKALLPPEAGGHRRLQQLGERTELGPGLSVVHTLAGVDDRPLRGHQHRGHLATSFGSGPKRVTRRGRVLERLGHVLLEEIDGEFHQHRRGPPVAHLGEGAPHGLRHGGGHGDLLAPLGHVLVVQERAEVGRRRC